MATCLENVKIEVPPRVTSTEGMVNLAMFRRQVNKNIMTRKLTHEFVQTQFKLAGYEMLSQYIRKDAKIDFRCDANHLHQITWNDFRNGQRCGVCAGKAKLTHDFVKAEFEAVGYEMLSEYVNSKTPIKFRCKQNHVWQITWGHFKHGERCAVCAGKAKLTHDFVKSQFEAIGYEMLETYVNCKTPIKFRCSHNHIHQIAWNEFNLGQRCGICAGRYDITHDLVKANFELAGYTVLSQYINASSPIEFVCDRGHTSRVKWNHFKSGHRCGFCHTENFYKNPDNKIESRIINTVKMEINKQSLSTHWSYFYSLDQIKAIADPIKNIYKNCPEGCSVDHIVPTSRFNLLREEELIACWNPANLRYLDAIANIRRGNRMTPEEIAFMEQNHPEIINAASRRPLIAARVP